jgi:hypothetical protein
VCTSEVAADTWLTRSLRRQPRKPSFAQPSMPDFTASRCMGASGRRQPASRLAPAAALPKGTSTPTGLPPACRCRLEGRPPSSAACICPCCGEGRRVCGPPPAGSAKNPDGLGLASQRSTLKRAWSSHQRQGAV